MCIFFCYTIYILHRGRGRLVDVAVLITIAVLTLQFGAMPNTTTPSVAAAVSLGAIVDVKDKNSLYAACHLLRRLGEATFIP